jgi:hypothetical protein
MNIFRNNCHYIFIGFYKFHSPATWLNLFMQSQGINEKIQKQLGQLLKNFHATRRDICIFVMYHKCQVHITTRLFTLWSAFRCVPVVYLQLQSVLFLFIIALTYWSSTTKINSKNRIRYWSGSWYPIFNINISAIFVTWDHYDNGIDRFRLSKVFF